MFCRWLGSCSHRRVVVHTVGPFIHGSMVILRHLYNAELYGGRFIALGERQCSRFPHSPQCQSSTQDVEKLAKRGQLRDYTQYGDLASFALTEYASHSRHDHNSGASPKPTRTGMRRQWRGNVRVAPLLLLKLYPPRLVAFFCRCVTRSRLR